MVSIMNLNWRNRLFRSRIPVPLLIAISAFFLIVLESNFRTASAVAPTLTIVKDQSNTNADTSIPLPATGWTHIARPCLDGAQQYSYVNNQPAPNNSTCDSNEPGRYGNIDGDHVRTGYNYNSFKITFVNPVSEFIFDSGGVVADNQAYILVFYENKTPTNFYSDTSAYVSFPLTLNYSGGSGWSTRYKVSFSDGTQITKIGFS